MDKLLKVAKRSLFRSSIVRNSKGRLGSAPKDGLYFGEFSKEEYDKAAKYVKENISRLESEIKGDFNVRENIGRVPLVPTPKGHKALRLDNLSNLLSETIKTTGPITLLAYMRQCLTHPQFGYYTTRDPLSKDSGDFITSPEISSMFGEMIGMWLFSTWMKQNRPSCINIVELGPGRGTLIYDSLKTFNRLNKGYISLDHISVVLIEASPVLRQEQHKILCGDSNPLSPASDGTFTSKTIWGNVIQWVETETSLKNDPAKANYIIAHEFFDALPIKSFVKTESGWRELVVEHTPTVVSTQKSIGGDAGNGDPLLDTEFHLTMSPKETNSSIIPELNPRFKDLPINSRIEVSPDTELYVLKIAQLINNDKKYGSALIIDYGLSEGVPDNTLRGIYKHRIVSPFTKPGEVDLSVDVDFTNIKQIARKACKVYGPIEQGDCLHALGIGYRADQLIKANSAKPEIQEDIYKSYLRLTSKDEKSMGKVYKFLCLTPLGAEPPVGFGGSV